MIILSNTNVANSLLAIDQSTLISVVIAYQKVYVPGKIKQDQRVTSRYPIVSIPMNVLRNSNASIVAIHPYAIEPYRIKSQYNVLFIYYFYQ